MPIHRHKLSALCLNLIGLNHLLTWYNPSKELENPKKM